MPFKLHAIRRLGEKAIVFAGCSRFNKILAQVFEHEFGQPTPIINGVTSRGPKKAYVGHVRVRASG